MTPADDPLTTKADLAALKRAIIKGNLVMMGTLRALC
jgi:hypothetical protein